MKQVQSEPPDHPDPCANWLPAPAGEDVSPYPRTCWPDQWVMANGRHRR